MLARALSTSARRLIPGGRQLRVQRALASVHHAFQLTSAPSSSPPAPPAQRVVVPAAGDSTDIGAMLHAPLCKHGSRVQHVLDVWANHHELFRPGHLATAMSQLGRSRRQWPREGLDADGTRRVRELLGSTEAALPRLRSRQVAAVMYAASVLPDRNARTLVGRAADAMVELAPRAPPQDLAVAALACAKADTRHLPLLEAVASAACGVAERLDARDISNLAWSFATLNVRDEAFFARLADAAPSALARPGASTQALANIAWAYARAGVDAAGLYEQIARLATARLDELRPLEIPMLLWALAKAGRPDSRLFAACVRRASELLPQMAPQSISTLVYAYAAGDVRSEALLGAVAAHVPARLRHFGPQALVNLAWGLCVASVYPRALLQTIVSRIDALPVTQHTSIAYLMQVVQLDNALRLEAPTLGVRVHPDVLEACFARTALDDRERGRHSDGSSDLHWEVSEALGRLRVPHENEYTVPEVGYFVDIGLPERRLVIEVNGPPHYFAYRAARPAGTRASRVRARTADAVTVDDDDAAWPHGSPPSARKTMKYRHLRLSGWRVLIVPFYDWAQLKGDQAAQATYLEERIAEATTRDADERARARAVLPPLLWD